MSQASNLSTRLVGLPKRFAQATPLDRFIAVSGLIEMLIAAFLLLDPERPLFWILLVAVACTLAAATLVFWRWHLSRGRRR